MNITLKFVTSKEQPTEEQMHYQEDRTTIKDKKTTKMSQYYQNKYLQSNGSIPDNHTQEESTLKPWIDPHQLKQHQSIWYKDGRQVVTGGVQELSATSSNHITILPVYGHPGISKTIQLIERTILVAKNAS